MPTITLYLHPELATLLVGVIIFVVIKSIVELIP